MLDPVANFITLTLTTGYDQNAVSVVVVSGGSTLPVSGSFNMTWFNSTDYPNPGDDPNVEVVRVNGAAISGNTLPLTRAQEGTAASPKNIAGKTYKLILGVTAKMISDIAAGLTPTALLPAAGQYKVTLTVGSSNADYITDGVADDVQIQQAINAIASAGGGVVYINSGTYNISATIKLPVLTNNCRLTGAGRSSIIRMANGVNSDMFLMDVDTLGDSTSFEMDNLVLDGNSSNQTSGRGLHIKNPTGAHKVLKSHIHDLFIKNVKNEGFFFNTCNFPEACYSNQVDHIWFDNCDFGLRLHGFVFGTISYIDITTPITYGIYMEATCSWTRFSSINIDGRSAKTADGIAGSNTNCTFSNCQVAYCVNNYNLTTVEAYSMNLTDCFSFGATRVGFQMIANNSNHSISMMNCFSASDGSNTGLATNLRLGFYLFGAGMIEMTNCKVYAQGATQYAVRHQGTASTFQVTTIGCEFQSPVLGVLYTSGSTPYTSNWILNPGYLYSAIFTGGNVGVGTQSPAYSLDVNGESSVTGNQYVKALSTPSGLVVTPTGATGAATWTYVIVARVGIGATAGSTAGTTSSGNATLTSSNYNALAWNAVAGATSYDIYRTAVGSSPSTTGKIANVATNSYNDQGAAGDASTAPTVNSTGFLGVGTATPSNPLQVVVNTSSGTFYPVQFNFSGSRGNATHGFDISDTSSAGPNAMVYLNDSNTNSNFASFVVNSARNGSGAQFLNSGSGNAIYVGPGGNGRGIYVVMPSADTSNAIEISQPGNSSSAVTGMFISTTNSGSGAAYGLIVNSGKVGFGTATPATSAALEIASTTGALLIPRMTTTQKNALTAVNGMLVYDATLNKFQGFENGTWANLI